MNKVKQLEILPPILEDTLDYAVLYNNHGAEGSTVNYLAYECHRDFLSAPRAYIILCFRGCKPGAIQMDADVSTYGFAMSEQAQFSETGMFTISNATPNGEEPNEPTKLFILIASDHAITVDHQALDISKKVYHCTSAQDALLQYLNNKTEL